MLAHCAERCHLLDRLALSFRDLFERLAVVATCECAEEDPGCMELVAQQHPDIAHMKVVSVPFDFGLSRGKSLLAKMAQTEFVLVLDDDFVYSFHSCLECMMWRMRSQFHSLWKPFDILGFPVLEDERLFGAFRGRLRTIGHQLFVEPLAEQQTPDGCLRVDICPMVFLARTARFRMFKFQESLKVGEHEQFFYSNAYLGAQVAVCFDSSFPHFRVNTMTPGYQKRRERTEKLMAESFSKLGFQRNMYLFKKHAVANMKDYDELLEKTVPPWYVSDDSCGPLPSPTLPYTQVFVVVFSTGDDDGAAHRHVMRGQTGASAVWLQRFAELGPGTVRWMFAVAYDEGVGPLQSLLREQSEHGDVVLVARGSRQGVELSGVSTEKLLRTLALMRDFHFRWLVVVQQDVFVHFERLVAALSSQEPSAGKVLGLWGAAQQAASSAKNALGGAASGVSAAMDGVAGAAAKASAAVQRLDPRLFALSRDVFALLSAPAMISRLATSGNDASLGDLSVWGSGLTAWLRAFKIDRVSLPGVFVDTSGLPSRAPGSFSCPHGALALHPVTPQQMHALSRDAESAAC